jgi:ubiquinone/menaquinone biosynthesis C-methylase UbiE
MTDKTGAVVHWAARYDLLISALTLGRERRFRERMLAPAHLTDGESVLDIGCGTGSVAIVARQQVGPAGTVAAIDPSPAMIERARGKSARAGADVRFEVGYAQALPFPDEAFDVVLSTVMLHHLPRAGREAAMREAKRVLKPHGRLFVVDFGKDKSGRKGLLGHIHGHGGLPSRDLSALAVQAGFSVVDSGPIGRWDLQFVSAMKS